MNDPDTAPLPRELDAVHQDPTASYARAATAAPVTEIERATVSAQLGRRARGETAIVHRCRYGLPTVVRVGPRLEDGTPFPTVFWATCPALNSQVGRLEADRAMVEVNARIQQDQGFADAYAAAAQRYIAFRDRLDAPLQGDPGAGGMPDYVKCLHVHAGHTLATGDNVVGEWTLERALPLPCPGPCVDDEARARWLPQEPADG